MDGSVLRLLDANANRAREAMRVLEDYARFILDSAELCGSLKNLRHDFSNTLTPWLGEAILHRDTPNDVGTVITAEGERTRDSLADVVTAAGKRLGESLRAIEEFLKTVSADDAAKIESLRYGFYEIEKQLAATLHRVNRFGAVRLYVLITESVCRGPWLETAKLAIEGGADCLQLREKDFPDAELLDRAGQLVALCHRRGVLCIINNRPDIALLADADGVHLGQDDIPAKEAGRMVGGRRLIGVSTHKIEQAKQAVLDGADYIGVGPVYKSATKPRDFVAGLEYAAAAARAVRIPTIAIAGIGPENIDEVLKTGVSGVAVSKAVLAAEDVRQAARQIKERFAARK